MSELLRPVNRMIGKVTNITGLYRYIIWVDYLQLLEALNGSNEDRLQGQRTSPWCFSIVIGMCVLKILWRFSTIVMSMGQYERSSRTCFVALIHKEGVLWTKKTLDLSDRSVMFSRISPSLGRKIKEADQ